MATLTLSGRVRLPDGRTVAASRAVTVTDPTRTAFGVDPSRSTAADFAQDIAWFAGAKVGATYGGAGEGWLPWSSPWVAPMLNAGYRITFSAKDYASASACVASAKAVWDTMPAPRPGHGDDAHDFIVFHEANRPAGGPVLATWKATFAALVAARKNHKNAARIKLGPNFSWWPAQIAHNEAIPWQSFMVPDVDFASFDQYWGSGMGVYADLDKFTALPASAMTGFTPNPIPVFIREFGVSDSQTDATAAQVIHDIAPVYAAKGFRDVSQFNYRAGVSGSWLTPTGRPLAWAAWRQVCANQ